MPPGAMRTGMTQQDSSSELGRLLLVATAVLAVAALVLRFRHRIPLLGRFPGVVVVRRRQFSLDVPLAVSVIFSLTLPAILRL